MQGGYQDQQGSGGTSARHPVVDQNSVMQRPVGYGRTSPQGSGAWQPQQPSGTWQPQQPTGPAQPMQNTQPQPWDTGSGYRVADVPDPFDTSDIDPELINERSDKVYSRKDPFWEDPDAPIRRQAARRRRRNLLIALSLVLAVTLIVLYAVVFRVHEIQVVGLKTISRETAIQLSGIGTGDSMFALNEEAAESGINSNRYLIYQSMEKEYPDRVTLTVKEREPEAMMNYCGINYTIDSEGMVLEESDDITAESSLIIISGMDLSGSGCRVGRIFVPTRQRQMNLLQEMMK